jgi:hypothetical protein
MQPQQLQKKRSGGGRFSLDRCEHLCYYEDPEPVPGCFGTLPARVAMGWENPLIERSGDFFIPRRRAALRFARRSSAPIGASLLLASLVGAAAPTPPLTHRSAARPLPMAAASPAPLSPPRQQGAFAPACRSCCHPLLCCSVPAASPLRPPAPPPPLGAPGSPEPVGWLAASPEVLHSPGFVWRGFVGEGSG